MTPVVDPQPMAALIDRSSTLTATIRAVDELEEAGDYASTVRIGVSSNVTMQLLGVYLRKHALLNGIRLDVRMGNHDDLLGDVDEFVRQELDLLIIHSYFDNLLPSFEAQVPHLSPAAIDEKRTDVRNRYRLAFEKAKNMKAVFVGGFHRMSTVADAADDVAGTVIASFNQALAEEAARFPNVRIIDADDIVRMLGQATAIDRRFYFRSKAPYSTAFLNEFARRVAAASRGFASYFYKALVLDCDNTLWGGVVGEDLIDGIKLDPHDHPGNIFWRVQNELLALQQAGVLLCLCSKNNPQDVDEVLARHPNMVLKDRHLIVKKVDWSDKAANLRAIAQTLNVGLESLVYLDDSDFECAGVRTQLPMVRTFQVPATLSDYPTVIGEIRDLFLGGGVSRDSQAKTDQYRQRAQAEEARASFSTNEEFLASLALRVEVSRDAVSSAPRVSELTMKSNQFNLTTRRYSVGEIRDLMAGSDATVYSVIVSDKFGNAGLTGVLIVRWNETVAVVDSFLMSCRVIGRGIELTIWNEVLRDATRRGCAVIRAEFKPTAKNAQVADFFDRLGMHLVDGNATSRRYESAIQDFPRQHTPWIEVVNVE